MTILVRRTGRQQLARSLFRDIHNVNDYFYVFTSRAQPWTDDALPETPVDSQAYMQQYKRDMLFVKKIGSADTVLLTKRYDWATGTVYDQYDDSYSSAYQSNSGATNLADANFYVITDDFNVYKCLDNNSNVASTVEPTATGTETFELSDGYVWKFMYQLGAADRTKFLSSAFMPVRKVAGTGNPSFDVNGSLDSISVTAGGSSYSNATVVITGDGTGATANATISGNAVTAITLTSAGLGYSFALVEITSTDGTGATATAVLGSTETPSLQQAVESTAVSGTIDRILVNAGGQDYISGDVVVLIDGDGTGATASATVDAAGTITAINVTASGSGYTFATLTLTQTVGSGTGCTLRAIVSPYEGHGGNPPKELFASNVGITTSLTSTNDDIIIGNEFRQIGLIKNIQNYTENALFTQSTGTPCFIITVDNPAAYNLDDIITVTSGGRFRVIQKLDTNNDGTIETVYLQEILPGITVGGTFNNVNTGVTGMTINSLTSPEMSVHSGDVMYIDNRKPITRDADQVETVKVIFNF
jgi:hypothetical protein|tara:strand:+ start:1095 stop:2690 length:1596 start_codon:yes stop_codon:yes gene_type:complete